MGILEALFSGMETRTKLTSQEAFAGFCWLRVPVTGTSVTKSSRKC